MNLSFKDIVSLTGWYTFSSEYSIMFIYFLQYIINSFMSFWTIEKGPKMD